MEDFKIKEDVRIAGIIQLINKDVEIVPRKLYYRDAAMKIQKNADFKGKLYRTLAIFFYWLQEKIQALLVSMSSDRCFVSNVKYRPRT